MISFIRIGIPAEDPCIHYVLATPAGEVFTQQRDAALNMIKQKAWSQPSLSRAVLHA